MKHIKKQSEIPEILNVGDYVKIINSKNPINIYRIVAYEPEFKKSPYGLRHIETHKFEVPNIKNVVKLEDYELAAYKYNI